MSEQTNPEIVPQSVPRGTRCPKCEDFTDSAGRCMACLASEHVARQVVEEEVSP